MVADISTSAILASRPRRSYSANNWIPAGSISNPTVAPTAGDAPAIVTSRTVPSGVANSTTVWSPAKAVLRTAAWVTDRLAEANSGRAHERDGRAIRRVDGTEDPERGLRLASSHLDRDQIGEAQEPGDERRRRAGPQLGRRRVLRDAAGIDHRDLVGQGQGLGLVVGHVHDREALRREQLAQVEHELVAQTCGRANPAARRA